MSTPELEAYLRELAQENPLVELEYAGPEPDSSQEEELLHRLRWLEDNDHQNRYLHQVWEEDLDPRVWVGGAGGLEETLYRFLARQLDRLDLEEEESHPVLYLAACLDENGYFRLDLEELSRQSGLPLPRLERALALLRSLEPAGGGAADLAQCLELQLRRIHEEGPALAIVRDHLEALARNELQAIADALSVPLSMVQQAHALIRQLEPRPGAVFQTPGHVPYLLPDVFVTEEAGQLLVGGRGRERPPFRIDPYYQRLMVQQSDPEVTEYLTPKLRQAEEVLWAVSQRESALLRCAQAIVGQQDAFFRQGPQALAPLPLEELAQTLELSPEDTRRVLREKHLQCSWGVFPLEYFVQEAPAYQQGHSIQGGGL